MSGPDLPAPLAGQLPALVAAAGDLAEKRVSDATAKVYARHWQAWEAWCADHGTDPLPADPVVVAAHVARLAGDGLSTAHLGQRLAALGFHHERHGYARPGASDAVRAVLAGLRRERSHVRPQQAAPLSVETIGAIVAHRPDSLLRWRDRAILLLGFATGLRRSELAALSMGDVEPRPEGLRVFVARGKTDQQGHGRYVGVLRIGGPACPVDAVDRYTRWLMESHPMHPGEWPPGGAPLFWGVDRHGRPLGRISSKGIRRAVDREAARAGFPPGTFSAHSLRAGMATEGARFGVGDRALRQGGWRRRETVDTYVRAVFRDSPSRVLGYVDTPEPRGS